MLKYLLIPFFFISVSCDINDSLQDQITNEPVIKIPQKIYNTSIQNHEWNDGWFNQINDLISYNGTSNSLFEVGSVYFDYDHDGDYDMFVTLEYQFDIFGEIYGGTHFNNIVLRNDGKNSDGSTIWTNLDVVDYQPKKIYRRLLPGDINNDGNIDIIAFIAEDPEQKNDFRTMGGLDMFLNDGNGGFIYKEIYPYTEGHEYYFHGATLGDVNNDGFIDILGFSNGVKIFLNNNGNFDQNYYQLKIYPKNVHDNDLADFYAGEVFDINQDGYLDLILGTSKKPTIDLYNQFYSNDDFGKHTEIIFGNQYQPPFFNVNSRTKLNHDYDYTNEIDWMDKTFCCAYDYSINDFDNDGDYDIFVIVNSGFENRSLLSYYQNEENITWLNKTNEIFEDNQQFVDIGICLIKTWDIDNDGQKEILIENTSIPRFTAWDLNENKKLVKTILK